MSQKQEQTATHVVVPVQSFEKVLSYLVKQPYDQVSQMLSEIKTQGKYIHIPPEELEPKELKPKEETKPDSPKVKRTKR